MELDLCGYEARLSWLVFAGGVIGMCEILVCRRFVFLGGRCSARFGVGEGPGWGGVVLGRCGVGGGACWGGGVLGRGGAGAV